MTYISFGLALFPIALHMWAQWAFAPLQAVWSIKRDRPHVARFFRPCPLKYDGTCEEEEET